MADPRAPRLTKICKHCGKEFTVKASRASQNFCSAACLGRYEIDNGREAARVADVAFNCRICNKEFFVKPSYLKHYRKMYKKDPAYCSVKCSAQQRSVEAEANSFFTCVNCGKVGPVSRYENSRGGFRYYLKQQFCSNACKSEHQVKSAAETYKRYLETGKTPYARLKRGYKVISVPTGITGRKHSIFEHRFVMERHLGRPLRPEETVHHVNGDRADNRLENLELFSSSHGPGQKIIDKVTFAIDILRLYPEFIREAKEVIRKRDAQD